MLIDYNVRKRIYVTLLKYHSLSRHEVFDLGRGDPNMFWCSDGKYTRVKSLLRSGV
jgi:hypothetical protein